MCKRKLIQPLFIGLIILSLLTGCFPTKPAASGSSTVLSTLVPDITLTPTIALTSTETLIPTLLPTTTPTTQPTPRASLVPAGASFRISKGPLKFSDLSPDGKTLLVGSKITVCTYQVADGSETWCRTTGQVNGSTLRGLAYSPDGKTFLTGLDNGQIILWDSASGNPLWMISNIKLNTAAWSPDGQRIVISSQDLYMRVLDTKNGNTVSTIQLAGIPPAVLSWSPDGKVIAAGDDSGAITLWNPKTGKVISTQHYFSNGQIITSLAWSRDSQMILAGSSYVPCNSDYTQTICGDLVLFDTSSGSVKWQVYTKDQVHALALSPDGSTVLARVGDYVGNLYNLSDGKLIQSITEYGALGAYWQPDGKSLFSIDWFDNLVSLTLSGQQLSKISLEGYYDLVDFAWSPDGSQLAASSAGGPVTIWDAASGKLLKSFAWGELGAINWSPDGKTIGTFGRSFANLQGILIDAQTGNLVQKLSIPGQFGDVLAWSPDGKLLAALSHDASSDGAWVSSTITIWDTSIWKIFQLISTNKIFFASKQAEIAWTKDGRYIIGAEGRYVWDIATGEQTNKSLTSIFSNQNFSPDGSHFVTNYGLVYNIQNLFTAGFLISSASSHGL
jgi:WD40 repeat protein